jgi:hypothetical protein
MVRILYDGIGANESSSYTVEEFLEIMNREFTNKKWQDDIIYIIEGRANHYQLQFKDWYLPDDFVFFTLEDWLEYSGAELVKD